MPIRVDGQIKALLNVEDTLRNAFSRDEQQTLRSLLDEVGNLLGAAQTQSLIVQTFLATPSAVFVTDSAGTIIKVNPAAAGMLGYSEADLAGTKFYEHIMNAGDPLALLKPGSPETETVLRTKGGTTVPVLAGAHELAGFGAWVISAKDISYRKRLEQLEMLGQMYSELAAQMKTPLTLASGWLRRLRKQKESSDPDTADVLTQTLAQVKKLDITFERLALYDRNSGFAPYSEILLDLAQLVNRVLNQLPKSEYAKLVKSHIPDCGIYVRGDACQITFVIETILSNLFRFLPEDERLCLEMADNPQRVDVSISGWLPLVSGPAVSTDLSPEAIRSTLNDMALGEQVIARFMADHGGHYSKATADGGITRFELEFPRVCVEV
jgi:PAS domain S-box-containing protein